MQDTAVKPHHLHKLEIHY